jgi:predicted transcriptional regulator
MRRSKLETYEAILEVLVKRPLTVDTVAYKIGMNCTTLTRCLDFLIKNGLVEERISSKRTLFAITERGIAVFKALNLQKYLERVTKSIRAIDDALQALPIISNGADKREENAENENY